MPLNLPDDWGVRKRWQNKDNKIEVGDIVTVPRHPIHDLGYLRESVGRYVGKKSVVKKLFTNSTYGNLVFLCLVDNKNDNGVYFHKDDVEKMI